MKAIVFVFTLILVFNSWITVRGQNILIGGPAVFTNEPSVCINPQNPDQIVIGSVPDNYYISADGGVSWQQGVLTSTYGVNCDPVILADNSGSFYYFHLVPDLSRVVCQKMTDFTQPWSNGSFIAVYNTYDMCYKRQ